MSTTKSTVLVKHHLKALKLPTMSNECEKVASRAAERRLKAARFPQTKTLDEFDFGQQPSINKPLVLELAKGQYIDDRENVLLIGSSGVGKTHLAIALGLAACGQGRKVRFFRVTEMNWATFPPGR
jgi:DNA replication protein DnaC